MKALHLFFCLFALTASFSQASAPVHITVKNVAGKFCVNDKITFHGQRSGRNVSGITDQKGSFIVRLPEGDIYNVIIETLGEDVDYNTIEVPAVPKGAEFEQMEVEITYEPAKNYVIAGLLFETGSDKIQSLSISVLNEIASILLRKKELKIEISGHTDAEGDESSNLALSRKRAEAVRSYLLSKGVSAARMKAIGYGESKPVASNESAAGRQKNRRTEITVL